MYSSPPRILMNRTACAPSPRVDFRTVRRIIRPTVNWVIASQCSGSKGSTCRFLPNAMRFPSPLRPDVSPATRRYERGRTATAAGTRA